MATDTKLDELVINVLTKEQFDTLTKDDNQLYLVSDDDTTSEFKLYRNNIVINGTINDNAFWLYLTLYQKTDTQITSISALQDNLIDSSGAIVQPASGYIRASSSIYMIYLLSTNLSMIGINSSGENCNVLLTDAEITGFRSSVVAIL